jgi:hypothetical protein
MMMPVAVIVVRVTSSAGFRRERTQLIFSGLENESKNTGSEHECHCNNSNFHPMNPPLIGQKYPTPDVLERKSCNKQSSFE